MKLDYIKAKQNKNKDSVYLFWKIFQKVYSLVLQGLNSRGKTNSNKSSGNHVKFCLNILLTRTAIYE